MAKKSKIEWTHYISYSWFGYFKQNVISDNCYALGIAIRYGDDYYKKK
jgi:hypothetical protein